MASRSTSELSVPSLRTLRLRSHDWLRLRLSLPTADDHDRLLDATYQGGTPIRASIEQPGKVGDLAGTLWPSLYAMGDNFRQTLERNQLSGWRAYELISEMPPAPGGWWVLGVLGRAGPIRSGAAAVPPGRDPLGHYLDPREWDGSDFFHPAGEGTILVTPRAFQALERARLKNVLLQPAGLEPLSGSIARNG